MSNPLAQETSPYLIQHAQNPVHWQAWSDAAFEQAAAQNKLVFLSVGYSTCHWCHVMAHESFEDERIAEVMNHHFVCVKVDREERPDIDAAYMSYVQASTGQGGWPMSVWLTPEGNPVFGGTYFPPDDRHGRPGFARVCHELARLWRDDRQHMESRAQDMMEQLRQSNASPPPEGKALAPEAIQTFLNRCKAMFDLELGGWGGAPKFPRPCVPRTLMQIADRLGIDSPQGSDAWMMTETTLRAMALGGMHDHLGGGFHRYSVDRYWHVPHYEKMLYDQAQLAMAYLDAWQISADPCFREVTEGIFRYLIDTMRDPLGAFHAAEDADSLPGPEADHPREGAFWTWEADEISRLLVPRAAAIFCSAYGVEADGNARPGSDPHGELRGQNTLFRARPDEELASQFNCDPEEIRASLKASSAILLAARTQRPHPHRDDKIISAWNGLAIGALARGGRILDRPDLIRAASDTATFLQQELWHDETLYRSFRKQRGHTEGFPADYSFVISGLIELHIASGESRWLQWAQQLQSQLDQRFWSPEQGSYLLSPQLRGNTLMSIRDEYDGAEPSANHVAAENLIKLATLLQQPAHLDRAKTLLQSGAGILQEHPFTAPVLLAALDLMDRGIATVHVPEDTEASVLTRLHQSYWPRALFLHGEANEVIVCEDQHCRPL